MSRVLVVEEDPQLQKMLTLMLQREGHEVAICFDGQGAIERISDESPDLVILDYVLPDCSAALVLSLRERIGRVPLIVAMNGATVPLAVELMRAGASDVLTKPFSGPELLSAVARAVGSGDTTAPIHNISEAPRKRAIITRDPLMIRTLEIAGAVARSDATVLIQGESGTGKELMARLIHDSSPRRNEPFVAVNCAALPSALLESELFGHEKGAFTGAHARKIGKFELAHRGTILLDEVSEMELLLQAKLLRVLQEREVDRVGGKDPVSVDVRVVATTNRKLEEMVSSGGFRADLYYRLNVIPLTLPSLRQRPNDIPVLAEYFMKQILGKQAPALTTDVIAMLRSAAWPGNIRELRNAVERAAILAQGAVPRQEDFLMDLASLEKRFAVSEEIAPIQGGGEEDESPLPLLSVQAGGGDLLRIRSGMTVHDVEKSLILETLRSTGNNRTQAANLLGISVRTLRNKLAEYRLPADFEGDDAIDEASSG
jgi:two-component system response regulator FlrC